MAKSESEKVADNLIDGASKLTWNPQLFIGTLMEAPPAIQRIIMHTMIEFIKCYMINARNPHLRYRTDPEAAKYAEEVESLDLTEFDQPW